MIEVMIYFLGISIVIVVEFLSYVWPFDLFNFKKNCHIFCYDLIYH
jgi:hypothetical protein